MINLSRIPNKNICLNHLNDKGLIDFFEKNKEDGICNYCQMSSQDGEIINLKDLVVFLNKRIKIFYGDASSECIDYDSDEGGWTGVTIFNTCDLFNNEISLEIHPLELVDDIINSLSNIQWCEIEPYLQPEHQKLSYSWKEFSRIVKHKNRYSFFPLKSISEILNDIAHVVDVLDLIKKIDINTKILRCRQHSDKETPNTFKDLSSPPIEYCYFSNRMSPAGVSMFYGAFDYETSKIEVIDETQLPEKQFLTMGDFKVKEELSIVDFSTLPEIPSIFSLVKKDEYYKILFFHMFVDDLSKDIERDNKIHIEYVPTQVLTEYFRYVFLEYSGTKIDGIIYKSSKNTNGKCCVLFMDNNESRHYLELEKTKTERITSC
jgi:hypothetical protein